MGPPATTYISLEDVLFPKLHPGVVAPLRLLVDVGLEKGYVASDATPALPRWLVWFGWRVSVLLRGGGLVLERVLADLVEESLGQVALLVAQDGVAPLAVNLRCEQVGCRAGAFLSGWHLSGGLGIFLRADRLSIGRGLTLLREQVRLLGRASRLAVTLLVVFSLLENSSEKVSFLIAHAETSQCDLVVKLFKKK